ncbi:MAG: hypothetical protein H7257_12645 [Taibaiella sp.]|nr:hypothetical protein [Taibaiella sp.]
MKFNFILPLLLFCSAALAQPAKITLTGTLTMATGEQFPYRIEGTEQNGVLLGFGYTYSAPNETKAVIEGRVDKQNHIITFKETEIVLSHDVHTQAFMCLVHARLDMRGNVLAGNAGSKQLDNTACTSGVLSFSNGKEVSNVFSSHDKYDMEVTMGGAKVKEAPVTAEAAPPPETTKTEKITQGVEKSYNWHSDSLIVVVWDGGNFDADKITISFDDVPVLKKYILLKEKKRIAIAVPATGTHTFSVYAEDEGYDPPNTASLTLVDGAIKYSLVAYNPKGAQSMVYIKRVGRP